MAASEATLLAIVACVASVAAAEAAMQIRVLKPMARLRAASALSLRTISDDSLTDDEKSSQVLTLAREILVASLDSLARIAVILGAFLLVYLGGGLLFGAEATDLWDGLGTWWLQTLIVGAAIAFLWVRIRAAKRLQRA